MNLGLKMGAALRTFSSSPSRLLHTSVPALCMPKIEKSLNQVTLLGRVGSEPQMRGNDQHPVVVFSLATNQTIKQNSEDIVQKTDWHRISVFSPSLRDLALNYVRKGQRVLVSGKISYGEIKMEEGTKVVTSIIADDIVSFKDGRTSEE